MPGTGRALPTKPAAAAVAPSSVPRKIVPAGVAVWVTSIKPCSTLTRDPSGSTGAGLLTSLRKPAGGSRRYVAPLTRTICWDFPAADKVYTTAAGRTALPLRRVTDVPAVCDAEKA